MDYGICGHSASVDTAQQVYKVAIVTYILTVRV